MNTLVVYDSQFGNTERIAQAIAETLGAAGQALAVRVDSATSIELHDLDLLVVGCPTQGWRPTPAIQAFLATISSARLRSLPVACFDTRFQMPRWMTGSAAKVMGQRLQARGGALLVPPESFFVNGSEGPLLEGELERAAAWAQMLAQKQAAPALVV